MKKREAALEKDRIKKHDFAVGCLSVAFDDKILATFALESGGLVINDCTCFYTPKGDLEFRLPTCAVFVGEQEYPGDRIKELLQAEIENLKAKDTNWNSYLPF